MAANQKIRKLHNKEMELANESLKEMLRRIGPYLPEIPKEEPQEKIVWQPANARIIPLISPKEIAKNSSQTP